MRENVKVMGWVLFINSMAWLLVSFIGLYYAHEGWFCIAHAFFILYLFMLIVYEGLNKNRRGLK